MFSDSSFRLRWLVLIPFMAAMYLVGIDRVPLFDRDEPRYAECSREMLHSGDWVVPRYLGELRTHKPPLIYWCQAVSMVIFGGNGGAARLPSAIAIMATAALLAGFVRRQADARLAGIAALVFCTSGLVIVGARLAITDAVLLLWICIGQGCLYLIRQRPTWAAVLTFWFSTGLAGLTKGPVVLAVHAGTLLVLGFLESRSWKPALAWWRNLRPVTGLTILAIVTGPWLIWVHQRSPDFLPRLLSRAGRYAAGGAEGHAEPPGYYLLLIWGLFFPWSILLPATIVTVWKERSTDGLARFALAAAIGPWLVMELITNKLPFYILPSFPALAVLTAMLIVRKGFFARARLAGWLMFAGAILLYGLVLPTLAPLAASRAIGRELNDLGAGGATTVAMIDYREPSLAFYQGGGAREAYANDLASSRPPHWAVITTDAWAKVSPSVRDEYQIMNDPVPVWMYNDGWRSTRLVIIQHLVQ
jgi:4-amino-4-deoxy-L-arabinose transferase-like glycosyltransferase